MPDDYEDDDVGSEGGDGGDYDDAGASDEQPSMKAGRQALLDCKDFADAGMDMVAHHKARVENPRVLEHLDAMSGSLKAMCPKSLHDSEYPDEEPIEPVGEHKSGMGGSYDESGASDEQGVDAGEEKSMTDDEEVKRKSAGNRRPAASRKSGSGSFDPSERTRQRLQEQIDAVERRLLGEE